MLPFFSVTIDPEGNIHPSDSGLFDLSDEELVRDLVQTAKESEDRRGILSAYRLRYDRFSTPQGQVIIFMDISGEMETVKGLLQLCLGIGLLSFCAFLIISILLANWAIRPVETAWNQQKQFVADASHELKTPLAVIMTNAELLQESGYSHQEQQRFSSSILTMTRQMRGLVESLLDLARADNSTLKMDFVPLDLSELIQDTLLLFEPVYFEKGLQLQSDIPSRIQVRGSSSHLQQVLEILLDNGLKYAAPGSTVEVCLARQGKRCILSVASAGEELSPGDLKNIFRRFYRVDPSRSRTGSYGLGLSIAQSIVSAHGGRIWAQSKNGINTFHVQLNTLKTK